MASSTYTIKKGDTFWSLEKKWNLPHGTLKRINPHSIPSNLRIGSKINIDTFDPYDTCLAQESLENKHYWGVKKIIRWKAVPAKWGGGDEYVNEYKDAWIIAHSKTIKYQANLFKLPVILLAGVCWIEVGGKPEWIDAPVYYTRAFDHSGDPYFEPYTITKKSELTSFGDVQIQLRRASETMGKDINQMSFWEKEELINCLMDEEVNIKFVAKHLYDLSLIDKGSFSEDERIRIIGARYNRGPHLSLEAIKRDTTNGDRILNNKSRLKELLTL